MHAYYSKDTSITIHFYSFSLPRVLKKYLLNKKLDFYESQYPFKIFQYNLHSLSSILSLKVCSKSAFSACKLNLISNYKNGIYPRQWLYYL